MIQKELLKQSGLTNTLLLHISYSSRRSTINLYQTTAIPGIVLYGLNRESSGTYTVSLPINLEASPLDEFSIRFSPANQVTLTYDSNYLADIRTDSTDTTLKFKILHAGETELAITMHDR